MTKLSPGQRDAIGALELLAGERPDLLSLPTKPVGNGGDVVVTIRLPTKDIERKEDGLPIGDSEDFTLAISSWFPYVAPRVTVEHLRFAGHAHVVGGSLLCVYMDPAREWSPDLGIVGFLNRLWDWLVDAAAGRFDPSRALFHPVGGVLHRHPGTPTVVVRHPIPASFVNRGLLVASLDVRTAARIDLTGWHGGLHSIPAPLAATVLLPGPLVFGGGLTLDDLLRLIGKVGFPAVGHVVTHIHRAALRGEAGDPLYVVVGARNAARTLPQEHHLLVAHIEPAAADRMRSLAADRFARLGVMAEFEDRDVPGGVELQWCGVSDERPGIATRRDVSRPMSWYAGKEVEIWGCGGIGSWVAELVVRAGARRVVVRDTATVTSGLLVRQNYTEADVGAPKAYALAARLRAVSDRAEVAGHAENVVGLLLGDRLPTCDLIIDATVNTTVAMLLDRLGAAPDRPALASMALDVPTATLGLLSVAVPRWPGGPFDVERRASISVVESGALEPFHVFWRALMPGEQVVPERGCSVPTFHGAAADAMAVAAAASNLLAERLAAGVSGIDLFAVGHAALSPHLPRRHRVDAARAAIEEEIKGDTLVRMSEVAEARVLQSGDEAGECRWLMFGEHSPTTAALWIDDITPVASDAGPDDVRRESAARRDRSYGLSAYIGDIVYRTGGGDGLPSRDELKDVSAAVQIAGGSVVLAVARSDVGVGVELHTIST